MPSVVFLGVGDATDFELAQTSVLYLGGCRLLIDCGPQIPLQVMKRVSSADALDGIYVTHCHADHCFGLASLLLWMRQNGRQRPLTLLAEPGVLQGISQLIEAGYPGAFSPQKCFDIVRCPLSLGCSHAFAGVGLSIAPTQHNLPNFALQIHDGRARVAISGDGLSTAQTAEIYGGLELLVHECAWLDRPAQHHCNGPSLVELCRRLRPARLAITHCASEQRSAIEAYLRRELGEVVQCPRPGEEIHFVGA